MPWANSRMLGPDYPAESSNSNGVPATWRICASPAASSRVLVFGPTPGSHLLAADEGIWFHTGRDFMERGGLFSLDDRADELVRGDASLTVILSLWPMALRMVRAISTGGFRRFAVRSK